MASPPPNPRVGVAAVVCNEKGELIMGKRAGSHGAGMHIRLTALIRGACHVCLFEIDGITGSWAFPGGHLEMGESIFACAERETLEETGLRVKGVRIVAVTNDVFDAASKHYVTMFVQCTMEDAKAQPKTMEPEKCEGWYWVSWDEIRQWSQHHDDTAPEWADKKCFLPIRNLVKDHAGLDVSLSIR